YKFLWAPLMDRYSIPLLGRRRGWLLATQAALLLAIACMGTVSPKEAPFLLAALALAVAFLSASQDIVFDAYRADVLGPAGRGAWLLLLVIILYKLGDAFAGTLSTAFLLRGAGFSLTDVGWANKWLGVGATILGLLIGGALMARLRLFKSLLLFGFLQAFTNLGFMLLAAAGKSYPLMITVIAAENLCGGMGTAAFVALLMAMCDRRFSATQYALLPAP